MQHLVIGVGEIGTAIAKTLKCDGHDPEKRIKARGEEYDVVHICFPYVNNFKEIVLDYKEKFKARFVVVHSTVPIGTCDEMGVVHSPVRGKHPDLEASIKTFKKYFGGREAGAIPMADEFERVGVKTSVVNRAKETEALKLADLMQYGASIMIQKEIYDLCQNNDLSFDIVYRFANESYNEGYQKMGMGYFTRPILEHMPGPIGGHCVVQMMELLDSPTAKQIIKENKNYGKK